jgi:hypothetical protein
MICFSPKSHPHQELADRESICSASEDETSLDLGLTEFPTPQEAAKVAACYKDYANPVSSKSASVDGSRSFDQRIRRAKIAGSQVIPEGESDILSALIPEDESDILSALTPEDESDTLSPSTIPEVNISKESTSDELPRLSCKQRKIQRRELREDRLRKRNLNLPIAIAPKGYTPVLTNRFAVLTIDEESEPKRAVSNNVMQMGSRPSDMTSLMTGQYRWTCTIA